MNQIDVNTLNTSCVMDALASRKTPISENKLLRCFVLPDDDSDNLAEVQCELNRMLAVGVYYGFIVERHNKYALPMLDDINETDGPDDEADEPVDWLHIVNGTFGKSESFEYPSDEYGSFEANETIPEEGRLTYFPKRKPGRRHSMKVNSPKKTGSPSQSRSRSVGARPSSREPFKPRSSPRASSPRTTARLDAHDVAGPSSRKRKLHRTASDEADEPKMPKRKRTVTEPVDLRRSTRDRKKPDRYGF